MVRSSTNCLRNPDADSVFEVMRHRQPCRPTAGRSCVAVGSVVAAVSVRNLAAHR